MWIFLSVVGQQHIFWGVLGVRSRGMTPDVPQETGRRRTTSEGQYQSSHDNLPTVHSSSFANNLAHNPSGKPKEVQYSPSLQHFFVIHNLYIYICVYLISFRVLCIATGKHLRMTRQTDLPTVQLLEVVVSILHRLQASLCHRRLLTSTCVGPLCLQSWVGGGSQVLAP